MPLSSSALASATSASSETSPVFYIVMVIGFVIIFGIMRAISTRRDRRHMEVAGAATGEAAGGDGAAASSGHQPLAVLVAPAPPFDEVVMRLRAVLGETTPAPTITRYTRPIVMVHEHSLSITEKKGGVFLTIPVSDIVSVTSGPATIKPRGTILPRRFPAVHVTVRRRTTQVTLALVPITGMYDKVTLAQTDAIAAEIGQRLETPASEPPVKE